MSAASAAPRELTDDDSRQMARRARDAQWRFAERVAEHEPIWLCWWNKNGHHAREGRPDDLVVCGLIDGMELLDWLKSHPDWWEIGKWDDHRYAAPVRITAAGRAALANREAYDLEPVAGGLVEPGWICTPSEKSTLAPGSPRP